MPGPRAPRPRTVAEHLARALALVEPLPSEERDLDDACGAVLAQDLRSLLAVPPFDAAAMDGYAVRAADVAGATPDRPVTLDVVADLAATGPGAPGGRSSRSGHVAAPGSRPDGEPVAGPGADHPTGAFVLAPGQAARIMTGAPVPEGCDAVVPVERTSTGRFIPGAPLDATVAVHEQRRSHIRRSAEDVGPGDVLARAGTQLTPRLVSAAASGGHGTLAVHRAPRVAVISTGSELVPAGVAPGHGQIPDSNSLLLAACAREAGAVVERIGAVPDTAVALRTALDDVAPRVDLVVTSGGVSAGAFDVVKEVLTAPDGPATEVELVAVGMQPGKPQALARWAGTPWIAAPGNPVAAFVSFEVFVRPLIGRLRGLADPVRPTVDRVAAEGWRSPPGREQFVPVVHDDAGRVGPAAHRRPGGGSGSHLVSSLARADGVAVVGADVDEVRPGDTVRVMVIA